MAEEEIHVPVPLLSPLNVVVLTVGSQSVFNDLNPGSSIRYWEHFTPNSGTTHYARNPPKQRTRYSSHRALPFGDRADVGSEFVSCFHSFRAIPCFGCH